MMYEGKHIHYSPVDNKPLCSYSTKLCKQRRLNGYAFCIRHILEDKSAPFKQCAHVAKYNNQKCTNPIPTNEEREYCNSHMQVAGMAPKKERKAKKADKDASSPDGKLKFADRLKALLKTGTEVASSDDQISVDDPYAFSESASETSTEKSPSGSVGSSPNSNEIGVAGNNRVNIDHQVNKSTTVSSTSALPGSISTSGSSDNKMTKSHSAAKSSKTMNRLQAKIAQNKILDKLKKNQDAVGFVSNSNVFHTKVDGLHSNGNDFSHLDLQRMATCAAVMKTNVSSLSIGENAPSVGKSVTEAISTNTNNHSNSNSNNCGSGNGNCVASKNAFQPFHQTGLYTVSVPPKKLWRDKVKEKNSLKCTKQVPNPVQRVQDIWDRRRLYTTDLYPLGIELSDSESDDNECESLQRHWFYTWDKGDTLQVNSEFLPNSRPARLAVRQSEMRRQYSQLCSAHSVSGNERKFQRELVNALLRSTKKYPNKTAEVVHCMQSSSNQPVKSKKYSGVVKRYCCYENERESCESVALPHTRHCVKHIMYNVDQLLFEHCTAKFADNTQCCVPVFDICHELPLCTEHARKRDNYNKMSAEPKPKKPRKKTKPSALTRPPKRGKKKKRQNGIRPNKQSTSHISALTAEPASTDVPSTISLGLDASHMSPGPTELNADDISKGLEDNLDDDLADQLSPGSIEKSLELPLDTAELANQASRLLEEHDFTEVLNKIPDDAFNDLFTESKNGDFLPTKEETEELERALAAVDKDVKSLEKLSGDNNDDMSELDLQESLLHAGTDHGIDDHSLGGLAPTSMSMDNLNVITSSLSTNDLNSISQVLSTITTDSMVPNPMPAGLVDNAILQSHIPGVHLLPDLVQGQLQLQVPVNATQSANFVLSPHLLGATFTTTTTASDPTSAAMSQGNFGNGTTISAFPQTVAHTIPLTTPDGISISLQSQLQGIRTSQWILSPADQTTFAPMVYQNGFPLTTQPFTGQVSTIGNLKLPFPTTSVDVLKQSGDTELMSIEQCPTFITVNGGGIGASNAFPVANSDSPKETVS